MFPEQQQKVRDRVCNFSSKSESVPTNQCAIYDNARSGNNGHVNRSPDSCAVRTTLNAKRPSRNKYPVAKGTTPQCNPTSLSIRCVKLQYCFLGCKSTLKILREIYDTTLPHQRPWVRLPAKPFSVSRFYE